MTLAEQIKVQAQQLGFERCGIAAVHNLTSDSERLESWLACGAQASLDYMVKHKSMRHDPTELVPGAKSIIVTLTNYRPSKRQPKDAPQVAQYAYGKDYHWVLKQRLETLLSFLQEQTQAQGRCFTDSAPIMERAWAQQAGVGFIGKSGMLISPGLGSYTLIGVILTTAELDADTPMENHCGSCHACIDACPTGAITKPFWMQTERCLAYQTIEKRGGIEADLIQAAGNRLFGCDTCLDVCPWNKNAPTTKEPLFEASEEMLHLNWETLTRSQFKTLFARTPLQRAGFRKIRERIEQICNYYINTK